jgi:hypothetical protein
MKIEKNLTPVATRPLKGTTCDGTTCATARHFGEMKIQMFKLVWKKLNKSDPRYRKKY